MKILKPLLSASVIALVCSFGPSAMAQTTTTIVNDDFSDGISNAGSQQIGLFTTSSSSALDPDQAAGPVDFATGSSGRAIHGTFAPQTLSLAGDRLDVLVNFTTPTTIAPNNNEVLSFGLFNTAPAAGLIDPVTNDPATAIDFNANITSSSSSLNTALNVLPGFTGELDDINAQTNASVGTSDLIFRTHNINNTANASAPTGRLMTTTSGFDNIGNGDDDQFLLAQDTDYVGNLSVTLRADGDYDLGIDFFDSAGVLIGTHTDTAFAVDDAAEVGLNTNTFDFLGIYASGGAFGSSNSTGDLDNGIDINNITVNFTTTAVPEPSSAVLLLGLGSLGLIRRRK